MALNTIITDGQAGHAGLHVEEREAINAIQSGAQPLTAVRAVPATPNLAFSANLAPTLDAWAQAGGAAWTSPNMVIPSGGSISTSIPVVAGRTYQIDITKSASTGMSITASVGTASITVPVDITNGLTVIAAATGDATVTLGGSAWVATLQNVTVRSVDSRISPSLYFGQDSEARANGGNTAIGTSAHKSLTTGVNNTAFGVTAQAALTTGSRNTAVGYSAQGALITGVNNTAFGASAQAALTTGGSNTAVGLSAQAALTSGFGNTAIGHMAQAALAPGSGNAAVGLSAQGALTTGNDNTAVGYSAQRAPGGTSANATTTASRQTSVGRESGQGTPAAVDGITTIGYRALGSDTNATALGTNAHGQAAGSVALGAGTVVSVADTASVGPRDFEIQSATKGLVLTSPDGSRWRATISNSGVLTWTKL